MGILLHFRKCLYHTTQLLTGQTGQSLPQLVWLTLVLLVPISSRLAISAISKWYFSAFMSALVFAALNIAYLLFNTYPCPTVAIPKIILSIIGGWGLCEGRVNFLFTQMHAYNIIESSWISSFYHFHDDWGTNYNNWLTEWPYDLKNLPPWWLDSNSLLYNWWLLSLSLLSAHISRYVVDHQ